MQIQFAEDGTFRQNLKSTKSNFLGAGVCSCN